MTNEEMLQDLKQFIQATVSQQMANAATKEDINDLRVELKADIKALDEKLDTIQDGIADTLTHATETTDATLKDHERRLGWLEHRAV
jgi:hypothetical protein